jgi:thiamine-monophosphate kinase
MERRKNEQKVIDRIERAFRCGLAGSSLMGRGDDAALWTPAPGMQTILTCDWFLEGTHFLRDKYPGGAVGWKCLARAVSDVAAMGGRPRCFLLSLALPEGLTGKWLQELLNGLRRASKALHCELAGGDTTRRDDVLISITVIGEIPRGGAILRSGAGAGDAIYVSGKLGEAELGLRQIRRRRGIAKPTDVVLRKCLYPDPRLDLGQWLAEKRLVSAMMDLSDGLSTDLARLCSASGVGAKICVDSLPVTSLLTPSDARELALHGGDDYELLFTVKKKKEMHLPRSFRGLRLTRIGEITREKNILLASEGGRTLPLRSGGWDPFRKA